MLFIFYGNLLIVSDVSNVPAVLNIYLAIQAII